MGPPMNYSHGPTILELIPINTPHGPCRICQVPMRGLGRLGRNDHSHLAGRWLVGGSRKQVEIP